MTPNRQPYLAALRGLLEGAGLRVGVGVAPKGAGGQLPMPYVVLYSQWANPAGDSVGCRRGDAVLNFRAIATAVTAEQAEAVAATAEGALVGQVVAVDGRESFPIRWVQSTGVERDDDVTPPVFYVSTLYSVVSAVAPEEVSP